MVGDIHGQFWDLLNITRISGSPADGVQILFLGDYVDRGQFSCECILYLLALKLRYPGHVWMIRGNHESRDTSTHFGFKDECKLKYGLVVYHKFMSCFRAMPIAAVIRAEYGNMLAVHGGISPEISTLEDISCLNRFAEPGSEGPLCDLMWSDPIGDGDFDKLAEPELKQLLETDWSPNPLRGCSVCFGYKALLRFLRDNDLLCLIRAHEVQELGFYEHFDLDDLATAPSNLPEPDFKKSIPILKGPVVTVFSAPNYCDTHGNKGALLKIGTSLAGWKICEFDAVPHPDPLVRPSQDDVNLMLMVQSCPYMPTTFVEMLNVAKELGPPGHIAPALKIPGNPIEAPVASQASVRPESTAQEAIVTTSGSSSQILSTPLPKLDDGENKKAGSTVPRGSAEALSAVSIRDIRRVFEKRSSSSHKLTPQTTVRKKRRPSLETKVSSVRDLRSQFEKPESSPVVPALPTPANKDPPGKAGSVQKRGLVARTERFTHEELVCLRLMFCLFDADDDDLISRTELSDYAIETGECIRIPSSCR